MKVVEIDRDSVWPVVLRGIVQTDVVLDVGPGIRPQSYFRPRVHLCVEAYAPYADRVRAERRGDSSLVFLVGTWQEVLRHLPDNSVDTAFALDLIEHLTKDEGYALLREMSRIARLQVVIFTPLGLYPQTYAEGEADAWGMGGGHWQTHRSGWVPEDLETVGGGWQAFVCPEFHRWDQHGEPLEKPFGAFWAVRTLSPLPAGARTAWATTRVHQLRQRSRHQLDRVGRFARSPVRTSMRVFRRLLSAGAG